ncbi:MAG: TonB-dependent receptor, partial [Bacteroidales bacterium]|nr:TonB-dependent receptor [Bacteroidales bacterium]
VSATAFGQASQTIRGRITDVASGEKMIGVTVVVDGTNMGSISDEDGQFVITGVPVGRHTIKASFVGYEPIVLKEQMLSSGKEMVLSLRMRECVNELDEIVIKPRVNKQQPLNEMALTGARMFSVEEATRYAGGMADPARTASMFAGVAASGATNGISIHGNSPQMLQWRIEGIEVNNPNHFSEITEAGGGIFTSLNGSLLANSDFLTGAMPAEYGNALSGAFDMKMHSGNNSKYEHAFQLGTLGFDLASEGPLGKKGVTKASYIINYRYSFLKVATELHAINMENENLDYQDLSFKLNFPTQNAGTFSVWFTGLYDNYKNKIPDASEWETLWDMNSSWSKQSSFAGGLTHSVQLKKGGTLRSSIAMTDAYRKLGVDDYDTQMVETPNMKGKNNQWNLVGDILYQQKFTSRYTMLNGVNFQHLGFDLNLDLCPAVAQPLERVYKGDGNTNLTRFFTSHKLTLTDRLSTVAGLNLMWFGLNNQWLAEPRVSVAYKTSASNSVSLAYALNSRRENTDVYFVEKPIMGGGMASNKELGLTRSHHISFNFSQRLGDDAQLKIEPYYQYVFDVPVELGTTFSMINNRAFYVNRLLVNEGAGRNYGIDLTLEHYLKNGFYGMLTATVFKSEYRDAQGLWHNTRYDRRYITNLLGGKEWVVGRNHSNIFGLNARITLQGGDRYTPIPEGMTIEEIMERYDKTVPEDTDHPFTEQQKMNVGFAFSAKYTINRKNMAHHFILEYLKMESFQGQTIDLKTKKVVDKFTSLTFPNIAYRVEF